MHTMFMCCVVQIRRFSQVQTNSSCEALLFFLLPARLRCTCYTWVSEHFLASMSCIEFVMFSGAFTAAQKRPITLCCAGP